MDEPTPLDRAHAVMEAAPDDDGARLAYYACLADRTMFVLLEDPSDARPVAQADVVPRVFHLETGPVVLGFDTEDRLSAFTGVPAAYMEIGTRTIARMLVGQGVGIGVNLGGAGASMLLDAAAVDWLVATLANSPVAASATPQEFRAPVGLPAALLSALDAALARAAGLADHALLAAVTYADGHRGHMIAFVGTLASAETLLARAVADALTFSGIDAGELDVTFPDPAAPAVAAMARAALRFDLPSLPAVAAPAVPAAPGSDPARPPKLR